MANIRIDLVRPIIDGQNLTFRSPIDCSEITGLAIYYPNEDNIMISRIFQFADAHGNNVGSINLFAEDALVKVILDTELYKAYVQNADTNAYLEGKFNTKQNKLGWVTDEDIDAMFAGTYNESGEDEDPDGDEDPEDATGAGIDDDTIDDDTTWSSQKIHEEIIKAATYEPVKINTFKVVPPKAELGDTITSVTFEWELNSVPTSLKIGEIVLENKRSGTYTMDLGDGIQKSTTYIMTATDGITTAQPKTCTVDFYNGVYYGVAKLPAGGIDAVDSGFVCGLSGKDIRSNKLPEFTVDAEDADQYIWYCLPVRYGKCTFVDKETRLGAGMILVKTISNFKNEYGRVEDNGYYVYRSGIAGLGENTYIVS